MGSDRLPVTVSPYGPLAAVALHIHDLTIRGLHLETLVRGEHDEAVTGLLGDERTARMIRLGRMYALVNLGRLDEALALGAGLARSTWGPRATDAKIVADVADTMIQIGRIDDGLHGLARALLLLETAPRDRRYISAMSSLCKAANSAELFELADECIRIARDAFEDDLYRSSADLQRAELLLEWALRLEQVDRPEEAAALYATSVTLLEYWAGRDLDGPLGPALLAVSYAKLGRYADAQVLIDELLLPMRTAGQQHEARLLHLAYGLVLRASGDLRGARRELLAGDGLAAQLTQHLIFRYELAALAAQDSPGEATQTMLATVASQFELLWRLRLDRRTMLRQAGRRLELEAARTRADLAASSDALTGLGNRRMFDRRINEMGRDGALLLIDVDRFKEINDAFSHRVGDRVLGEIAAVLRAHCRQDEVAIRFGGDEFAMFLTMGMREAALVARRIQRVILARDWNTIAAGLSVTLSMGLAAGVEGLTGHDLYDRADSQLYTAKRRGRNQLAA